MEYSDLGPRKELACKAEQTIIFERGTSPVTCSKGVPGTTPGSSQKSYLCLFGKKVGKTVGGTGCTDDNPLV